ncbi:MAG: CaiB/BaiF CoA transferase family protein [Acidimicrobiia bacterium]
MNETSQALRGLTVVDLTTGLASAYTSLLFADFGAEVIQIERPGGSRLRSHPSWPFWMRGKKSIVLDFDDPADLAVAKSLAAGADIVIASNRAGSLDRFGLGPEQLTAANPTLIYTAITGFGRHGRYSRVKAYDALVLAKTGSMYGANRSRRPGPVVMNAFGPTFAASFLAMQGTLLAVHERFRSGRGQVVDATLLQGMMAQDPWTYFAKVLTKLYPDAFNNVMAAPSQDRPVPTTWLTFGLLTGYTKDGRWMQFAHATPKQFDAFMHELGFDWMRDDPDWNESWNAEDVGPRDRFWTKILEEVRKRTTAEWQEVFDRNSDTFAEIFRAPEELFEHPQIVHDGYAVDVDHAGIGTVRQMGALVKMAGTPPVVTNPPPAAGEHDAELRNRPARAVPDVPSTVDDKPALDGVMIVDLGTFYAAPFGSTMLTDHGARVIKVEPLEGDPIRYNMPVPEWAGVRVTQGKESIAVDTFSPEGKAIVTELLRRADVVLHSYRGGVAKRMGFDLESTRVINPTVVYHHAQGYGVDGPYARRAAYAPTIAAGSGFTRRSGGGGPEHVDLDIDGIKDQAAFMAGAQSGHPDGFAALGTSVGLALGIVTRDLGHGTQNTMTTMMATMGHVMSDALTIYDGYGGASQPDPELYGFGALYRLYQTSDSWVMLVVDRDDDWETLARVIGRADLAGDRRFANSEARAANAAAIIDILTPVFAERTASAWESVLLGEGVACVEVTANLGGLASGLMDDGQLADEFGYTCDVEHPLFGVHKRSTALVRLSRSTETMRAGCLVGQHTDDILRELGYSDDRITELRAKGVVG